MWILKPLLQADIVYLSLATLTVKLLRSKFKFNKKKTEHLQNQML